MNLEKLNVVELEAPEMRKVEGGFLFGLICITGVLDGIPGNTKIHFGRCKR